jgi:hypothetical protein
MVRMPIRLPWQEPRNARQERARRRIVGEVQRLEDRQLLTFAVMVTATPQVLSPPNNRVVPVVISGKFTELDRRPPRPDGSPPQASFFVVDDYHRIQPKGPIHLTEINSHNFTFSFTVNLQASRSTNTSNGRHYYVTVAAKDSDGWSGNGSNKRFVGGANPLAVWVPK